MNIQVGDRVTYKYENEEKIRISIVNDIDELEDYITMSSTKGEINSIEILKIERPKYEIIEEKKELLTEEEKEYIKLYAKFNDIKFDRLKITIASIEFINNNSLISCYINTEINFDNIKKGKIYKKEELGL